MAQYTHITIDPPTFNELFSFSLHGAILSESHHLITARLILRIQTSLYKVDRNLE